jgi:hypothetical protein
MKLRNLLKESNEDLRIWWDDMPHDFKTILKFAIGIQHNPSDEELELMTKITKFDASNFDLKEIYPIYRLIDLETVNLENTSIMRLDSLKNLKKLKYLNLTFTFISTLNPLENLNNLQLIKCKRTPRLAYEEVKIFQKRHPHCKMYWDYETDQHWLDFVNWNYDVDQSSEGHNILYKNENKVK